MDTTQKARRFEEMERELRFLWQEAHEEVIASIKERKIKQYWELFRAYKKQKQFLLALETN
ncbi:MAG: hypothetical protein KUL82_02770 [Bdellovibrio sp.]|uniref:hypothetical protein n=1 Tax=Bdellovibrio sp. TaxID=28201 RepID=UPI0039E435C1|nr:hypothetical protein [Bdellovibrio sp.]